MLAVGGRGRGKVGMGEGREGKGGIREGKGIGREWQKDAESGRVERCRG